MKLTDIGNPTTKIGAATNIAFMGAVLGLETTNLVFNIKGYRRPKTATKSADSISNKVEESLKKLDEAVYMFAPTAGITLAAPQQEQQEQPPQQPQQNQNYYQPQYQGNYQPGYQQNYYTQGGQPPMNAQGQPGQNLQGSRR